MNTIFINSKNSKTSEPYFLMLKFTDKLDLKRGEKSITLSNLSIYNTRKNIKSSYNAKTFKISAPTQNDTSELPDGLYSVLDTQDYFYYILKKHIENINTPSVRIYVKKKKKKKKIELHLKLNLDIILSF